MEPELTEQERRWITFQLLNVLSYMHSKQVAHNHLCPENIALTPWLWLKLTDLGSYRPFSLATINKYEDLASGCESAISLHNLYFGREWCMEGDVCFMSPERFKETEDTTENRMKGDVYSAGLIIAHLHGCKVPSFSEIIKGVDVDISGLPEDVKELVRTLLFERKIVVPEMQEEFDYMRVLPIHQPYDHANAIEATVAMLDRTEVPMGIHEIVSKLVLYCIPRTRTVSSRLRATNLLKRFEFTESIEKVLLELLSDTMELVRLSAVRQLVDNGIDITSYVIDDPCEMIRLEVVTNGNDLRVRKDHVMKRANMSCLFEQSDELYLSILDNFDWSAIDGVVLEEYYLPAILDAMISKEPVVILKYLHVLESLVELIDVHAWYECLNRIVPLLIYPYNSIRDLTWRLIDMIAKRRTKRHVAACILPAISAISKEPKTFSRSVLTDQLPRNIFEEAIREQALDNDWLDNLDASQSYTALLLLLAPWIVNAASYGVPFVKKVDERMLFLREVIGLSFDEMSLNESLEGVTRCVPEVMANLTDRIPTIGRIWQSWSLVPRLAKRLILDVKRILVSPDRQWIVILSQEGQLSFWDCRTLLQVDQSDPVYIYDEQEITDICFCESTFEMLASFADDSLGILKPSVQITSKLDFSLEITHTFEHIGNKVSQLHHFHTSFFSFAVFVNENFELQGFDLRSGELKWSLELDSLPVCDVLYSKSAAFVAYSDSIIQVDLKLGLIRKRLNVQGTTAMCLLPEPASQIVNQSTPIKLWLALPEKLVLLNVESENVEKEIKIDSKLVQIVTLPSALVVSMEDGRIQVIDLLQGEANAVLLDHTSLRSPFVHSSAVGAPHRITQDVSIMTSRPKKGALAVLAYPQSMVITGHWDGSLYLWQ